MHSNDICVSKIIHRYFYLLLSAIYFNIAEPEEIVALAEAEIVPLAEAEIVALTESEVVSLSQAEIVALAEAEIVALAEAEVLHEESGVSTKEITEFAEADVFAVPDCLSLQTSQAPSNMASTIM